MTNKKKRKYSLLAAAVLLLAANGFPVWQISLTAPQYPEPVYLYIYTHKLTGAVDTLNILNHYIGMHPMPKEMIEFTVFPIALALFSVLALLCIRLDKYYGLWGIALLLACVVAGIDFYAWEYYYGTHLDPKAPLKIEGQQYIPPLIGKKNILNFEATSLPHIGFLAILLSLLGAYLSHRLQKK